MMKIEYALYAIGTVALAIAVIWFTWEYILALSANSKLVLLILLTTIFLSLGYQFKREGR
ncbi:MAG: hypothetical protein KKI07_02015 [Euryarchaeota archaeon]|nr:hypothetical protein [Euryarchaeota archaeon]